METTTLEKDIKVFYVAADSFPEGIMDAHKKLHALKQFTNDRKYFGISRPENGVIIYKAAVEELYPGEAEEVNCETLVLKKGNYTYTEIHDYMNDLPAIGETFKKLLSHPGIDPQGYCVEWYSSDKDVKCMVRLKNEN